MDTSNVSMEENPKKKTKKNHGIQRLEFTLKMSKFCQIFNVNSCLC